MRDGLITIMIYEWRILKAGRLAQLSIALLVVMIGASLATSFTTYSEQCHKVQENRHEQKALYSRIYEEIRVAEQEHCSDWMTPRMLRSGPLAPSTIFDKSINFRATSPPGPLTMMNIRQLSWYPQTFAYRPAGARYTPFYRTFGTRSVSGLFPERPTDNPLMMLVGQLDLAFITLNIVPLLLLILSFNILATEKESGTLALVLSNPVSLKTVVIGKLGVRFVLFLSTCAVAPLMTMLLLTALHNPMDITAGLLLRSGLWLIAVAVYIVFWLVVSLLINAFDRSSSFNALISVIVWLNFVAIVPAVCNQLVNSVSPGNQSYRFVTEERAASLEINARIDTAKSALNFAFSAAHVRTAGDKASKERYDSAYFLRPFRLTAGGPMADTFISANPEWRHANTPNQLQRMLTETRGFMIEGRLKPVLKEMEISEQRQQRLSAMLSVASPAMLIRYALDDISEVGARKNASFLAQLDTYIRSREKSFNEATLALRNVSSKEYEGSKIFTYNRAPLASRSGDLFFSIGGSLLFTTVVLLWSLALLKSYRVVK